MTAVQRAKWGLAILLAAGLLLYGAIVWNAIGGIRIEVAP